MTTSEQLPSRRARQEVVSRLSAEFVHALRGALSPAMMVASHMENDCSMPPAERENAAVVGRSIKAALKIIETLRPEGDAYRKRSHSRTGGRIFAGAMLPAG